LLGQRKTDGAGPHPLLYFEQRFGQRRHGVRGFEQMKGQPEGGPLTDAGQFFQLAHQPRQCWCML